MCPEPLVDLFFFIALQVSQVNVIENILILSETGNDEAGHIELSLRVLCRRRGGVPFIWRMATIIFIVRTLTVGLIFL